MLIDGDLVEGSGGEWLTSIDPATEEELGRVPVGNGEDVARAVEAAQRAQIEWGGLAPAERSHLLRAVAASLRDRSEEILHVEVVDTGNTITKMSGDVAAAAAAIEYFAGLGSELKGNTIPATGENLHLTLREPYGVVGRIVPFNHPVKFCAHALAAPLMAGNAVVVKPPEQSPLSALLLAEICQEILPPGLVNILTGPGMPTGDAIVRHPLIKRIAFTGSVPTGMAIGRAAAETGIKHVTLELGGKNPLIAFPDVEPEKIAEVAVKGMNFAWQGQSCGSTSRLLLHESQYDEVLGLIVDRVAKMRVGEPLDPDADMGPINNLKQYEHVTAMVAAGKEDGARLVIGGARPPGERFTRGYWFQPTVFADVEPSMRIAQQEIFGPVLSVLRWRDEEEALEIANGTEYGLTASIWTNDIKRALRVARAVKAGYVWINGASGHFYGTPFGGQKSSGLGREEGLDELLSYTENKTIHVML
jgi:acyl-CoA reductase-like NAD-dependent aldehyde dehydrogenase